MVAMDVVMAAIVGVIVDVEGLVVEELTCLAFHFIWSSRRCFCVPEETLLCGHLMLALVFREETTLDSCFCFLVQSLLMLSIRFGH